MAKNKKVALVKDGKDIGRIIPFNYKDGDYDFKINFLENDFNIGIYKLLDEDRYSYNLENSKDWEFSYHRRAKDKNTKIHLKLKNPKKYNLEGNEYKTLPLERLQDPCPKTDFPIPFMKIEIPKGVGSKEFKPDNEKYQTFDIKDSNVVEIFLVSGKFSVEEYEREWPCMHFLMLTQSFEIYATNSILTDYSKMDNFFSKDGAPRLAHTGFAVNKDITLICNIFNDGAIDEDLDKIRVTFIENQLSTAILGMMKVTYSPPINGVSERMYTGNSTLNDLQGYAAPLRKSPFKVAFQEDLDRMDNKKLRKIEMVRYGKELRNILIDEMKKKNYTPHPLTQTNSKAY